MLLTRAQIENLEKRYRATLINSITGFKPANLIGTADRDGHSNLAIVSSVVHLGSHPPLIAHVMRPNPVERHTLENILETGVYTINHVADRFIEAAHQTAARYPREQSEFDATGLTEHWAPGFAAPYVAEANIRLGMRLREHHELAVNGTHFVIGEIEHLEVPDACVDDEGRLDLVRAGTVAVSGLDTYHAASPLKRMAYAKPDLPPREVE
jgi:flavin reductase (DIM6/NTAB) family NADH-FMN oxidoreductase RutF